MKLLLPFVLAAAAFMAAAPSGASLQPTRQRQELSDSEKSLVEGSREAIIRTGFSEAYFDEHFRLARVVDRPGDRRVVWSFSVGGHAATVSDSVGFYTEDGRRFDTHSVAGTLNTTSDLTRTITRARAERIMRRCIGRFTNPQVEYRAHGPRGAAALLLTAEALVVPRRDAAARETRERREREEREERDRRERARQQSQGSRRADPVEEEDEGGDGAVLLLGAVNLSTGECTVGRGQSGPPVPARGAVR